MKFYHKKIESMGPDHYHIALSLSNKYRKMSSIRLPSLVLCPGKTFNCIEQLMLVT